jgi:hypothetical protein
MNLRIIAYALVHNVPIRSRQLSGLISLIDDRGVAPNISVHG